MGKHLAPQLRNPRTWYCRTVWLTRRRDQLQQEPLCQPCLRRDRVVPAVEVHHLIPFGDSWELFISGPLESSCKQCHAEAHNRRRATMPRIIGLDGYPTI